jgi:hypothetical protein
MDGHPCSSDALPNHSNAVSLQCDKIGECMECKSVMTISGVIIWETALSQFVMN